MIKKIISSNFIIWVLLVLLILVSIVKFQFTDVVLSAPFYTAEFLIYAIAICVIYLMALRKRLTENILEVNTIVLDNLKQEFGNRESELLKRIIKLEEKDKNDQLYTTDKEKTVSKLFQNIDSKLQNIDIANQFLIALSRNFEFVIGIFYLHDDKKGEFEPIARYGVDQTIDLKTFKESEGFCGQAVASQKILSLSDIPEDYLVSYSGLGSSTPIHLYFIPIIKGKKIIGLIEIGSYKPSDIHKIWDDINIKLIDLLKIR